VGLVPPIDKIWINKISLMGIKEGLKKLWVQLLPLTTNNCR